MIEAAPYTLLLENLSRIAAVAHYVSETAEAFEVTDLLNLLDQVGDLAAEAVILAGATHEEQMAMFEEVVGAMRVGPSDDPA